MGPLGAALITAGSGLITNIWNAREARKNRDFQERMSSTSHQREVRDLRAAGINPMIRSLSGASTPSGDRAQMDDVGSRAVTSALGAAQLRLVNAQTDRETSSAQLLRVQADDIQKTGNLGRWDQAGVNLDLAKLDLEQRRELLPSVLARAKEEIRLTSSSARRAEASAMLDEAAAAGAMNMEAFEKRIGEAGPWVRQLYNLLRLLKR